MQSIAPSIRSSIAGSFAGALRPPSLGLYFYRNAYSMGAIGSLPSDRSFSDLITFSRASDAGITNSSGLFELVGPNVPRFDYDPVTLQPLGLLIEEARTNLLLRSAEFDNAAWTKARCSATVDAPRLGVGFSAITATETNANGAVAFQSGGAMAAGTCTASTYIEEGSTGWAILVVASGANGVRQWFNLSTGALGSSNTLGSGITKNAATVQDMGSGVLRLSLTANIPAATITANIYPIAPGDLAFTCTLGHVGYVGGAQLEAGAFPTSHIPTEASTVTRAADVASVNTLSPWYNALEGTLFVEWAKTVPAVNSNGVSPNLVSMNGNSTNTLSINHWVTTNGVRATVGAGATQADFNLGSVNLTGAPNKTALAIQQDNFAACSNGGSVQVDTLGVIPVVTTLRVGHFFNDASRGWANGHIRSLRYWPRRLPNAELQELTA